MAIQTPRVTSCCDRGGAGSAASDRQPSQAHRSPAPLPSHPDRGRCCRASKRDKSAGHQGARSVRSAPRGTQRRARKPCSRQPAERDHLRRTSAAQLREMAQQRNLALGEAWVVKVRAAVVPARPLRDGHQPVAASPAIHRQRLRALTESEADDLRDRTVVCGGMISDYVNLAISAYSP